ncbi:MAG: twin-arginine translocase subunit TatB [Oceanicaulis sp.]|uniref:Sec-independent protein translocase protein TatB n=1 Tax=Glycocaulis sp. TaxID=1969725 RepID=UPI0025C16FCC|nr:Sec-independent protein translocase protein TatB [Glycocaulis sp.]MCC5981400.1 twin-arginine translocase subunit TatB [Oceanicaulis sp.]MCH8522132.1 Sec-independent protein translocase protein TatB [Glycocaulis sp.]
MNPGFGAPELIIIVILALVVVGPKDLPLMMRKAGRFLGQMRAMARDFQRSFDELGREAELAELKKEIDALKKANPVAEVTDELRAAEADLKRDALDRPHPRAATPAKPAIPDEELIPLDPAPAPDAKAPAEPAAPKKRKQG